MAETKKIETLKPDASLESESGNPSSGDLVAEVIIADGEDQATISDPPTTGKKKGRREATEPLPVGAQDADIDDKTSKAPQTSSRGRKVVAAGRKPGKSGEKTPSGGKGKKKPKKGAKNLSPSITLGELAENYLAHLEEEGKGHGTLFSYGIELKMACRELGAGTKVASLTEKKVRAYFESDAVTKNRKGKYKAKPTIDKTRRILRLALTWLEEIGVIEKAPIPDMKSKN